MMYALDAACGEALGSYPFADKSSASASTVRVSRLVARVSRFASREAWHANRRAPAASRETPGVLALALGLSAADHTVSGHPLEGRRFEAPR
jgi:hypothetical protein